ncbi:uncharacterized protein LOC125192695 [Salvia hispanica]|uniref:uncharacterized protein LOC125192695 n=1 Tax=Salvia hispanica TaxID=49212 RepID=UPI0020091D6B|nr:uncharacterized protein LOC125192695 [Salvia hispanica]
MTRVVAQLDLSLEQQERKGTSTQKLQFWPFWNRVIPSGSTPKDQNEVQVDKLSKATLAPAIKKAFPLAGSTAKDQNEVEVDKLPKAIHATGMQEDYVPFILFGETKFSQPEAIYDIYFSLVYNGFQGVVEYGEDASIERLDYMPKNNFRISTPLISWLKHENVVELVVYNLDGRQQILAYDYAPRASLHDILHELQSIGSNSKRYPALSWSQRIQIALGVAKGLCYIHDRGLIHDNIRSRNVLLCDDETAKIIDPFLWTPCPQCSEIVYNTRRAEQHHVPWALQQLSSNKVHKIVDARLEGDYPPKAVEKMAKVAQLCLREYYRPKMVEVVQDLELCLRETKSQHSQDGPTQEDYNEAGTERYMLDVPVILFGKRNIFFKDDVHNKHRMSNGFTRVLKNGEDATVQRLRLMLKHGLKHENMAKLVVYDFHGREPVLAYDCSPRGSLHDILHKQQDIGSSSNPYPALLWSQRIQIAIDVARGLRYIHDAGLIHHNIRSNNVILCDDETAKIIDPFLWTRWLQCGPKPSVSERKPFVLHDFSESNDVYNFGEVLLELLTGSKLVDNTRQAEQRHLVSWMAKVAQLCLRDETYYRPEMRTVVQDLELCLSETKSQHSQR